MNTHFLNNVKIKKGRNKRINDSKRALIFAFEKLKPLEMYRICKENDQGTSQFSKSLWSWWASCRHHHAPMRQ